MTNRLTRGAGSLAMLWSLVVLGAPAPLADCDMPSMASGTHAGMVMHHQAAANTHGKQPTAPKHQAGRAPCCSLTCGCGSFASLSESFAAAPMLVAIPFDAPPIAVEPTTSSRPPHSQPFAHAPPLI